MRISTESVITRTKVRLGLMDTTLHDSTIEMLVQEAARHLDAVDSYVITCVDLEIDCHKVKLPDNCTEILCIQLLDPDNTGCVTQPYDPATDISPTTLQACSTNGMMFIADRNVLTEFCGMGGTGSWFGNVFDTQNGYLVFPSFVSATEVRIWYRGLNTDENGIMIIDDFQERGLSAYAAYQFANSGQNYKSYAPQQVAMWQREATAQINKIRGKAAQLDHRKHKGRFASIARAFLINDWNNMNANL